jgi:TPR repeat protein
MQYAGVNYLAPIDAKLTDEADLRQLERVDDIVADLQRAKNLRILVLDSCRDNPLAEDLKRSVGTTRGMSIQRGLAKIENPEGLIVAYATQAGRIAEDGSGRHSPFTTAFLKYFETPEEIGTVFRRISADVYAQTKQTQLPELSLSLIGEFYLHGKPDVRAGAEASAGPALSWSEAAQAWAATKDTTSQAVLEDFVRQFGNTVYGNMAQARLRELKSAALDTQSRQRSEPSAAARPVDLPDPRRRDLVTDCDRLAAFRWDPDRPPGVIGVVFEKIDVVPALAACNDAMRQYPDVARFYYQAGRVALKQKDDVLARQYYEKAVSMGSEAGLVGIGTIYRDAKDYAEARRWFEKAAAAGVPVAMNNLGNIYGTGLGVAKDYAEAGRWYEKAAVAGEPEAMTNLGELYRTGMGVAQDYAEARRWYEKAAAAGEPNAMLNLGEFYRKGTGVPQNFATARQWYEKAAAAGLPLGMTTLGFLYGTGAGVATDYGEARRWWEKAAAAGERGAMWNLGEVYRNGYGVPRNLATARQWYEKAAAAGDDRSKEILKTLARTPNRSRAR